MPEHLSSRLDSTTGRGTTLPPRRAVIYGAGTAGRAARALIAGDATRSVLAFADSDARKQGTMLEGMRVVALDGLPADWFDDVVVASRAWRDIVRSVVRLGIARERIWLYHEGENRLRPVCDVDQAAQAPAILVLTDDCVSPGHGTGAAVMRHLADYPAARLSNVYLRRTGDPYWANSLPFDPGSAAGDVRSAAGIAERLAAEGCLPDVVYANVSGEPGLEALAALLAAVGSVPVIQHFHDCLDTDRDGFARRLNALSPRLTEIWAITDTLGACIAEITGREVRTMNTFKRREIAPAFARDHRTLDGSFRAVMLGSSHMPWVLHHLRRVWQRVQAAVPGLGAIQWYGHPTSALYVQEARVEFGPEIEYRGHLNSRALHEQLCEADLAIVPFNIADESEYHYATHSVPSRIAELLKAGLPIVAAAGRGTEAYRFLTEHGIGLGAAIADEIQFERTLLGLMGDTARRAALSTRARAFAEAHCDLTAYQQTLTTALRRVAGWRDSAAS